MVVMTGATRSCNSNIRITMSGSVAPGYTASAYDLSVVEAVAHLRPKWKLHTNYVNIELLSGKGLNHAYRIVSGSVVRSAIDKVEKINDTT